MKKKIFFSVLFIALINLANSQITTRYNQGYLRDLIITDSSIFTVHFNPSEDTLDYTDTKASLILYKFDLNLNLQDSLVLDSLRVGKCIERNGDIFIVAPRAYPDTFTCSINLFHLNSNLDILNSREFKEVDVIFEPSDIMFRNDSLYISVTEYRRNGAQQSLVKEFRIDTIFLDLDTVSCSILENSYKYTIYNNSITMNNKRIYSGTLNTSLMFEPVYYVYSDNGTCNNVTPFSIWENYILNETNFFLIRGNTNFILEENNHFFVPIAGEENFGNFDSFTGIIKTDSLFNPINYYIYQATSLDENIIPFSRKSVSHFADKIILASNTKMEAIMAPLANPYEENEMRIDILDTNMNFVNGINLDPLPDINYRYSGSMIQFLPDGGILLGGEFISMIYSDPSYVFLIKYSSLSELLGVSEENNEWNSLVLYPNPANDMLKIENNGLFENTEVKFYDVTGKLILSTEFNDNGFSVTDFSSGIYFVQIQTEAGNFSGKFIKE